MKELARNYKRLVVKIGSSLFSSSQAESEKSLFYNLASDIGGLVNSGLEVCIVSSGAIALGMRVLGLKTRPKELSFLQAAASLGQNVLMDNYSAAFKKTNLKCAQVLLTWEDFSSRKRYLNARNTIFTLFSLSAVPVINENDAVSTDEIKFGDNDTLSARLAGLIDADLLIILSDVDGLLDKDNHVIPVVDEINAKIKALASPTDKQACVGGMVTKIEAARISTSAGIPCVIASGRRKNIISLVLGEPQNYGTLFTRKQSLTGRERWLAFGSRPKGKIIVDDGASRALINRKSLLSVGVIALSGNFECGDIVAICDKEAKEIARGKTTLSSRQLDKIKGIRSEKEVIHCDNIVVLIK